MDSSNIFSILVSQTMVTVTCNHSGAIRYVGV